jgi:hypothetical protein
VTTKAPTQNLNEPLPDHQEILASATNVSVPSEIKVEAPVEKELEVAEYDKQPYGDERNGESGQNGVPTWSDVQVSEEQVNNYNEGSAEEESRGVGIKEDG